MRNERMEHELKGIGNKERMNEIGNTKTGNKERMNEIGNTKT